MKDWLIALGQAIGLIALVIWAGAAMVYGAYGQQKKCDINEFYVIAWNWHYPADRHDQMLKWLNKSGPSCGVEELVLIWNNLGEWAGTGDSVEMRGKVLELYGRLPKK